MDSYVLDTNVIIDALSADILHCLYCNCFYVSQVVFKEEINKQAKSLYIKDFNIINETFEELLAAQQYKENSKHISFHDALNLVIAKKRKMILVTGDQQLLKYAKAENVKCIGTITLIELLIEKELISANESMEALNKLKLDSTRRVPHKLIDELIAKIQKEIQHVR